MKLYQNIWFNQIELLITHAQKMYKNSSIGSFSKIQIQFEKSIVVQTKSHAIVW